MKKNTEKKLKISKKTVATLNRSEMNTAKGGNNTSYQTAMNQCPSINGYNCGSGGASWFSRSGFRCCN